MLDRPKVPGYRSVLVAMCLAALAPPTAASAALPGETLLASGLPGLAAPVPADFAFNVSGRAFESSDRVQADITADGTKVAFSSQADGFVSTPEARRYENVFVKNRTTGELVPVAPGANGSSRFPSISDDGTKVAFETTATNLVADDTTPDADVVVEDLPSGTYKLLSSPGDDSCVRLCALPEISGNGQFVAFATTAKLAAADTNTHMDVYRVPTGVGMPQVVDLSDNATPTTASDAAEQPSISADGDRVAYETAATGLSAVATDSNSLPDIYVRDFPTAKTFLISAQDGSNTAGDGSSTNAQLSGDGSLVAYASTSTNLAGGDASSDSDVYARTLATSRTQLVSRASGATGVKSNRASLSPHVNETGTLVTFVSYATNLGGGITETYARSLPASTTSQLGAGPSAQVLALSGTGAQRLVIGGEFTPQLEPGVSVITAGAATREIVSRPTGGGPLVPRLEGIGVQSGAHALSVTGRFVVFLSGSPGLPGARDYTGRPGLRVAQVYRRDQQTGAVVLVSRAGGSETGADSASSEAAISADGNRVAFVTSASLDPADTYPHDDAYVRDVAAGTTTLVSRADGASGAASDGNVSSVDISGDGGRVAFHATAGNLGAANSDDHVYVRDLSSATTIPVDRAAGATGAMANGGSGPAYGR